MYVASFSPSRKSLNAWIQNLGHRYNKCTHIHIYVQCTYIPTYTISIQKHSNSSQHDKIYISKSVGLSDAFILVLGVCACLQTNITCVQTRGVMQNIPSKLADGKGCRMRSRTERGLSPETLIMVFVIRVSLISFPNSLLNFSHIFLGNDTETVFFCPCLSGRVGCGPKKSGPRQPLVHVSFGLCKCNIYLQNTHTPIIKTHIHILHTHGTDV